MSNGLALAANYLPRWLKNCDVTYSLRSSFKPSFKS